MHTLKIILGLIFISLILVLATEISSVDDLNITTDKWLWTREKIIKEPRQQIDYALIGSSRIWGAMKPHRMAEVLPGARIWNLANHWVGRDTNYFFIKHLFKHHDVKNLLVEVTEIEPHPDYIRPHPYARYLIEPSDIMTEADFLFSSLEPQEILTYSTEFKDDIKLLLKYVGEVTVRIPRIFLRTAVDRIRGKQRYKDEIKMNEESLGFNISDPDFIQDQKFFNQFNRFKMGDLRSAQANMPLGSRSDYYLKKIEKLARKHNVRLIFVYHPTYLYSLPSPQVFYYYETLGDFFLPNLLNIYHIEYWRNYSHMYGKGADAFTDEILSLLKNGHKSSPHYNVYK